MKIKVLLIIFSIITTIIPVVKSQATSNSIVIGEVSMGSSTDATDEYVVWRNNSNHPVDISGWAIEYKSAKGASWSKKAVVASDTSLDSYDEYTFATKIEADAKISSGFAQAGGNLRILNSEGHMIDQLAWGEGDSSEGHVAPVCNPGESLRRKLSDDGLIAIDTDDNSKDFEIMNLSPTSSLISPEPELDATDITSESNPDASTDIIINELLPDPASPLSDATDEFIELFNTSSRPVKLNGWSLADKSDHKFIIGDMEISGHGYVVLYSKDSKISLNNTGDEIRLMSPAETIIDTSPNYENAKSGLSWGLVDGAWAWTKVATPGSVNSAAVTPEGEASAIANAKSKAKATKAKAIAKAKTAKKIASSKKPNNTANAASGESESEGKSSLPWWSWLLITLGVGTIGYGIYEYRPEIKLFYHKLRTKFSIWRKTS